MSAQTIAEAFAPAEARYRAVIMEDTWGHLAPKKNKKYSGHIVWALGCFGSDHLNPTVLDFNLGALNGSPWLFDAMIDFLQDHSTDEGAIFRFDGYFRNYEFVGTIKRMVLAEARQ